MCARITIRPEGGPEVTLQPGKRVKIRPAQRYGLESVLAVWGGGWSPFARLETLREKWLSAGWKTGTVEVAGIAERSHTGELVWSDRPGRVAVVWREVAGGRVEAAIVTRAATVQECAYFGHHRVPVLVDENGRVVWQEWV